jgi:hypothetical protein
VIRTDGSGVTERDLAGSLETSQQRRSSN